MDLNIRKSNRKHSKGNFNKQPRISNPEAMAQAFRDISNCDDYEKNYISIERYILKSIKENKDIFIYINMYKCFDY